MDLNFFKQFNIFTNNFVLADTNIVVMKTEHGLQLSYYFALETKLAVTTP